MEADQRSDALGAEHMAIHRSCAGGIDLNGLRVRARWIVRCGPPTASHRRGQLWMRQVRDAVAEREQPDRCDRSDHIQHRGTPDSSRMFLASDSFLSCTLL